MSHSSKRRRLSTKLHTSRSEYGLNDVEDDVTARRYTTHLQRLSLNFHVSESEEDDDDNLEVLINNTWKVFRVSPLNNFSYTTVRLKQYGRRMREGLSILQTDSSMEAYYDVKFDVEKGLTQTENDKEAVKITVNLIRKINNKELPCAFYLGYLICRGAMQSMEGTHLPVLLCKGTVRTLQSVHLLMQKFFDCLISPLHLSQEDMMWICALMAEEKKMHHVELVFMFPQLSLKNKVTLKLPHASLESLWECVHDADSEFASLKEVKLFRNALWHQLKEVLEVDLGYAQLVHVKTRYLSISTDCKLSAKSNRTMSQILSLLYEVSTVIDSSVPMMSVQ